MFDQNAELEENRRLDKLLDVLANQDSEEGEDDYNDDSSDCSDLYIPSQDEDSSSSFEQHKTGPIDLMHCASLASLIQHISFEEFDQITDCKDPKLQELMLLNRAKDVQMNALIAKYKSILAECDSSLQYHYVKLKKMNVRIKSKMRINSCGFPYFHYDESRPANNSDYFRKKASNIVNLSYVKVRTLWTLPWVQKLRTCVLYHYYENLLIRNEAVKESESKKGELVNEIADDAADASSSLMNIRERVSNAKPPDLHDDTYINWEFLAQKDFKDRFLAQSLRAMWRNYAHPSLNASEFTDKETQQMLAYVKDNPDPDWAHLAKLLNTNRSEYQLCSQYQLLTNTDGTDDEEDENHSDDEYGSTEEHLRWTAYSGSGTYNSIRRKKYAKSVNGVKQGKFSTHEDLKILSLVKKYGENFDEISSYMPDRTKWQIKMRYENNLRRDKMQFGNFKLQEDQAILDHVRQHGAKNWDLLALQLPRNSAQLRHRYNRLKAHDFDLNAMERKMGYACHLKRHQQIRERASAIGGVEIDQLESMPVPRTRMHAVVDDELLQFFSSAAQLKKTRKMKHINGDRLERCTASVRLILGIFQATLNIPKVLDEHRELDKIDFEILNELRETSDERNEDLSESYTVVHPEAETQNILMPPNVSSIQALRFLLLQSFSSANSTAHDPVETTQPLLKFKERFKTFFKIPSLVSIVNPPEIIKETGSQVKSKARVKRAVGRPKKDLTKIKRMLEAKQRAKANSARVEPTNLDKTRGTALKNIPEDTNETGASSTLQSEKQLNNNSSKQVGLSFIFEDGELKASGNQATAAPPASNLQERPQVGPVVLMKVDKATIQRLKEQNLLKTVKPIHTIKQKITILEQPIATNATPSTNTSSDGSATEVCCKKRSPSDKNVAPNAKKVKTSEKM